MFIRETSPDGKVSYWTIRPEANRCLTLDQVYKVSQTDFIAEPLQRSSTSKTGEQALNLNLSSCFIVPHFEYWIASQIIFGVFFPLIAHLPLQPGCDPMTAPVPVPQLLFPYQVRRLSSLSPLGTVFITPTEESRERHAIRRLSSEPMSAA